MLKPEELADRARNNVTSTMSVKETTIRIVGDHLGIPGATLQLDTHIANDLGADSLDHLELIMTVEERFGIKIAEKALEEIQQISDIVKYVEKALEKDKG